ncbi:MAG: ABC transporter substrate-binding protein [Chloroflexota bacterium]|nr:ABC transporter substrate-binding protein [Chloroflexota bacterium]
MHTISRKGAIGGIAAVILLAACQAGNNGSSASAGGSAAASVPAASQVATVPTDQLNVPGSLFACIDIPYPPQEAFSDSGEPIGSDVDLGREIATRLGLKFTVENTVFPVIIPALLGNKCDIIISAQNINADRLKQVDMIPYFKAGQAVVVAKGNPKGIKTKDDLCGTTVAVQNGTTELDFLQGTSDYKGAGLSAACVKAGKQAINIKTFDKDSDALLALQAGTADSYFADSPAAGYAVNNHATQFELSGITLEQAIEGISVAKTKTKLRDAVKAALLSMIADGKYDAILQTWGLKSGGITAEQVNSGKL